MSKYLEVSSIAAHSWKTLTVQRVEYPSRKIRMLCFLIKPVPVLKEKTYHILITRCQRINGLS